MGKLQSFPDRFLRRIKGFGLMQILRRSGYPGLPRPCEAPQEVVTFQKTTDSGQPERPEPGCYRGKIAQRYLFGTTVSIKQVKIDDPEQVQTLPQAQAAGAELSNLELSRWRRCHPYKRETSEPDQTKLVCGFNLASAWRRRGLSRGLRAHRTGGRREVVLGRDPCPSRDPH
jgi:hypothetical protein